MKELSIARQDGLLHKEVACVAAPQLERVLTGEKENGARLIRALLERVLTGD